MNNQKVDTIFLRDTLKKYTPHIDTKYMTFTKMKETLRDKLDFQGKLTRQDIINHFTKFRKPEVIVDQQEIVKDVSRIKGQVNRLIREDPKRRPKYIEIKSKLNKINNSLKIAEQEIKNELYDLGYKTKHDGTIERIQVVDDPKQYYHSIEDIDNENIDIAYVDNFMNNARQNPTKITFDIKNLNFETAREIARQFYDFLENEFIKILDAADAKNLFLLGSVGNKSIIVPLDNQK